VTRATDASSLGALLEEVAGEVEAAARSLLLWLTSKAAHKAREGGSSSVEKRAGQLAAVESVISTTWTE